MHSVIYNHVLPLVGKVQWTGFQKNNLGSLVSLTNKFVKHVSSRNADKLIKYLAFCIQEWPKFSDCPIDKELIDGAIRVIDQERN